MEFDASDWASLDERGQYATRLGEQVSRAVIEHFRDYRRPIRRVVLNKHCKHMSRRVHMISFIDFLLRSGKLVGRRAPSGTEYVFPLDHDMSPDELLGSCIETDFDYELGRKVLNNARKRVDKL